MQTLSITSPSAFEPSLHFGAKKPENQKPVELKLVPYKETLTGEQASAYRNIQLSRWSKRLSTVSLVLGGATALLAGNPAPLLDPLINYIAVGGWTR